MTALMMIMQQQPCTKANYFHFSICSKFHCKLANTSCLVNFAILSYISNLGILVYLNIHRLGNNHYPSGPQQTMPQHLVVSRFLASNDLSSDSGILYTEKTQNLLFISTCDHVIKILPTYSLSVIAIRQSNSRVK